MGVGGGVGGAVGAAVGEAVVGDGVGLVGAAVGCTHAVAFAEAEEVVFARGTTHSAAAASTAHRILEERTGTVTQAESPSEVPTVKLHTDPEYTWPLGRMESTRQ